MSVTPTQFFWVCIGPYIFVDPAQNQNIGPCICVGPAQNRNIGLYIFGLTIHLWFSFLFLDIFFFQLFYFILLASVLI